MCVICFFWVTDMTVVLCFGIFFVMCGKFRFLLILIYIQVLLGFNLIIGILLVVLFNWNGIFYIFKCGLGLWCCCEFRRRCLKFYISKRGEMMILEYRFGICFCSSELKFKILKVIGVIVRIIIFGVGLWILVVFSYNVTVVR